MLGAKRKCVLISVYDFDPDANIDALGHSEHCNLAGTLERGRGTQHMLKTALAFTLKKFSHLSGHFIFKDTSYIECMRGYKMSLAVYEILNHGRTWYEKHFRAYPWTLRDEYISALRNFRDNIIKAKPDIPFKNKQLGEMYEKSSDLASFIHGLKEHDCFLFKVWADVLVRTYIPYLYGIDWCISVLGLNDIPTLTISELNERPTNIFVIHGGGDPQLVAHGTGDILLQM